MNPADYEYMAQALTLAQKGMYTAHPNPRVGCVLVKDRTVVGTGWHQRAGGPHAEIHAIKEAGEQAQGATAYVSLEPCCHHGKTPPCSEALIAAGVSRVVIAMLDPNPEVSGKGIEQLQQAGIEVESGIMEAQAEIINSGFVKRMRQGRPYVRSKLAMSLDGRTAMASGESKWITGDAARQDVHKLRARSSAIMTGIGTVLTDDPSLNVRVDGPEPEGGWMQPLRVILDPRLSMSESARMLGMPGRTVIATACDDRGLQGRLENAGAEILHMPAHDDSIDLQAVMDFLGAEQMNEVLLETGATLSGAMLKAGLIDELIIYMAPHLMGNAARGLFNLPWINSMEQKIGLDISDIRPVGKDWRITATVTTHT
jgi:diaminohydroxyphosphoribosylaminopyrimidine deaminase/5-amino-6-(5-phosphoribosylamino)uracil reductase